MHKHDIINTVHNKYFLAKKDRHFNAKNCSLTETDLLYCSILLYPLHDIALSLFYYILCEVVLLIEFKISLVLTILMGKT